MWSFRNPGRNAGPRRTLTAVVWTVALCSLEAAPLDIRTRELPWAPFGNPYRAAIETQVDGRCLDGGVGIALVAGTLPRGLELRGETIDGTPEEFGAFRLRLRAFNKCAAAERDFVLQVTGRPILRVHPEEIVVEYRAGSKGPEKQTLLVSATWPHLDYTVTKGSEAWLKVGQQFGATPYAGSPYAGDLVEVQLAPSDLAPGVYESALLFSAQQGAAGVTVPVRLRVVGVSAVSAVPAPPASTVPTPAANTVPRLRR
jgi:hypothetical protein